MLARTSERFTFPSMKERRIKCIGAFLLLASFILQPLAAQENGGAVTNRHSLWKVQGKNNVVYLLGSIHLLKPENFPLPSALETAFSNSQVAVFETDVEKLADPQLQATLMSKAQLPAGQTLKQHLSAETYAAFTNQATESGLPVEMLESMKPPMAAMMLSMVAVAKLGADPAKGLDKYFADKARQEGKQVIGLETADFQIDMITSFPEDEDDLVMKSSLKEIETMKQSYGDIVTAWQTGNGAAIEKLLNDSLRDTPAIFKRMVTDRNQNWAPRIEELLHGDKNAIVIVGVAHLVGKDGVVELLKGKGLKVRQL